MIANYNEILYIRKNNEQETRLFKTHRKWKDNNEQVDDILSNGNKNISM